MGAYVSPFIWDQSGNYPAGPNAWNGTPKRVLPAQGYYTPGVKPPAQYFNDNLAQISGWQQFVHPLIPVAGADWRTSFAASAIVAVGAGGSPTAQQFGKAIYDSTQGAWLLVGQYNAGIGIVAEVYQSAGFDDGALWGPACNGNAGSSFAGDATGIADTAVCVDPQAPGDFWAAAIQTGSASLLIAIGSYLTSSMTTKATISTAGSTPTTVQMASINTRVVVGLGGSAGAALGVYSGSSSVAFALVGSITATANAEWALVSNGSTLIALPLFARPTSPTLWTTTDGVTFTSVNISSIIPVGAYAVGLAWSATQSLWYMGVQVTGSSFVVYSSPDGATWTQVGTSANVQVADMAAVASGLVITSVDQAALSFTTACQSFFSPDFGVTWRTGVPNAPIIFSSNSSPSTSGYTRTRLASSGQKLLAWNTTRARFSWAVGTPSTHI